MSFVSRIFVALALASAASAVAACADRHPTVYVDAIEVAPREPFHALFDAPIDGKASNQYWLAVTKKDRPDDEAVLVRHLDRGDTSARLHLEEPGVYEVRLHGHYPVRERFIVSRTTIEVVAETPTPTLREPI